MLIYYRDSEIPGQGFLIASHEEGQNVPTSAYGDTIKTFMLSAGEEVERIGDAPSNNVFDARLIRVPVAPTLPPEGDKEKGRKDLFALITQASDGILSQYPQSEVLSWPTKEAAAKLYLDGGDAALTPTQKTLLDAELSTAGGKMEDLCTLILLNAEKFSKISGFLSGLRQNTNAKIDAAKSQDEINTLLKDAGAAIATLLGSV